MREPYQPKNTTRVPLYDFDHEDAAFTAPIGAHVLVSAARLADDPERWRGYATALDVYGLRPVVCASASATALVIRGCGPDPKWLRGVLLVGGPDISQILAVSHLVVWRSRWVQARMFVDSPSLTIYRGDVQMLGRPALPDQWERIRVPGLMT